MFFRQMKRDLADAFHLRECCNNLFGSNVAKAPSSPPQEFAALRMTQKSRKCHACPPTGTMWMPQKRFLTKTKKSLVIQNNGEKYRSSIRRHRAGQTIIQQLLLLKPVWENPRIHSWSKASKLLLAGNQLISTGTKRTDTMAMAGNQLISCESSDFGRIRLRGSGQLILIVVGQSRTKDWVIGAEQLIGSTEERNWLFEDQEKRKWRTGIWREGMRN